MTESDTKDPQRYWDLGPEARSLQTRWKEEAGIDVVARVMELLRTTTGMTVRLAREGDKDYFAGVLRAVDKHIDLHADYAPYVRLPSLITKGDGPLC